MAISTLLNPDDLNEAGLDDHQNEYAQNFAETIFNGRIDGKDLTLILADQLRQDVFDGVEANFPALDDDTKTLIEESVWKRIFLFAIPIHPNLDDLQEVDLDDDQNQVAQQMAEDSFVFFLNGKTLTPALLDQLKHDIGDAIEANFAGLSEAQKQLINQSVFRRILEISRLNETGVNQTQIPPAKRAAYVQETDTRSKINPSVTSELGDWHVVDATSGFAHKLARAARLGRKGFDLKTKGETKAPPLTDDYVAGLQADQARLAHHQARTPAMRTEVDTLSGQKERDEHSLQRNAQIEKDALGMIVPGMKVIASKLKGFDSLMAEFVQVKKGEDLRAALPTASFFDKIGMQTKIFLFKVHGSANSPQYGEMFEAQTELEERIMELETRVMADLLGEDLTLHPIAANLNATSTFDPVATTPDIFRARQDHLIARRDEVQSLFDSHLSDIKDEGDTLHRSIKRAEQRKERVQSELFTSAKQSEQIAKRSSAELERIFWHEFGDMVKSIRKWRKELPKAASQGRAIYNRRIQTIRDQYALLERQVTLFQTLHNIEDDALLNLLKKEIPELK